jgi:antitoxin HicB
LSLASSVRTLDERQRAIVFLRFHADMTEREIGRELGLSQAHVSRLLTGALAQLRTELRESSDDMGDGDSNADRAISPDSQSSPTLTRARKSDTGQAAAPQQQARIGGVLASHENRTLAHYLELPYTVTVKSERNGERSDWTATVEELPACTARGQTPGDAVDSLRPAMERWLTAALADRREIPVPAGQGGKQPTPSSHSGRFLVRMPGTLHEQLARVAKHEELSLNRFVTNVLADSVSRTLPTEAGALGLKPDQTIKPPRGSGRKPSRAFRVALATNLVITVLAGVAAIVLLVLALQSGV